MELIRYNESGGTNAFFCKSKVFDPIFCYNRQRYTFCVVLTRGWLGSRVVSMLDSGAEGPGFKSQPLRCRVTVLGKLFTPIVPLFTKQQNW